MIEFNLIEENHRRNAKFETDYDPIKGIGCCGPRVELKSGELVPKEMVDDPEFQTATDDDSRVKLRCRYDFEYWAVMCAKIKDKSTGQIVPFRLNEPQRRVLAEMEQMRRNRRPIRMIMLKARQWGGSTLVQLYMAWFQTTRLQNWHSLICAHVKDTASTIRGMYTRLLNSYPKQYWESISGEDPEFKPFEGSRNVRIITGRGCTVTVGSSENQEAVRGADYAMAHLSEVAFWCDTPSSSPEGFIRAVCGAINSLPDTLIVLESTANGVGNYFHREWLRSVNGESDKLAVFVPWYEISIYRAEVTDDTEAFYNSFDDYEKMLWQKGCSLEQISWYRTKLKEYPDRAAMQAEYPTTAVEAFSNSDANVFSAEKIELLRPGCRPPIAVGEVIGDAISGKNALKNIRFVEDSKGCLKVWQMPDNERGIISDRYVVTVDIGGRSRSSDYSVIAVIDRAPMMKGGLPEIVAQWRGHDDHDIIAWKSASIASWYHNALLVVESNTLETDNIGGDPSLLILNDISSHYRNLYTRQTFDGITRSVKYGFHTNRATKTLAVSRLITMVRETGYVERDTDALDEMMVFRKIGNSFGAADGYHDDILMTRAIGLLIVSGMPQPTEDDIKYFTLPVPMHERRLFL
ncbi:MAG: hypothetical protein K2H44_01160 [Muribaculaceae bacterium]|nr:hypothetical protein [Muribaculaceae bacterium]